MNIRKLLFYIFFMNISFVLFAGDYKGLDFKIKFFNQSIYRVNSNVFIEVSLSNSSESVLTLEIGDINSFGFDFDVTDTTNIKVKRPIEYVKKRSKNVAIPVRNMSLRPNEKFSVVINLNQFVKFSKDGVYFVKGIFFPDISDPSKKKESNIITLFLNDGFDEDPGSIDLVNLSENNDIQDILKKKKLSPDEIVTYLLKALQLGKKEKFFLYLDIEGLLLNDKGKAYLYKQKLSPIPNKNVVEEYKEYLWNSNNSDISKAPNKFSIIETTYSDTSGKVIADLYFDDGQFYISKRYTFFFKKYDYYWIIYDYIVQNTGIKEK
ncbi:hypothetical protein [Borreliella kurtenbachii]|uniref:hypothetical protein n=1 Tax=Borreliella kurtenbachii TaxID=1196056 RepID=UPI002659AC8E|nr:hypothetical protein [Borreliella kurtenbachii]WKC87362.1 hypothetical protein QIA22_03705 [Borreliella kurtenbachii]